MFLREKVDGNKNKMEFSSCFLSVTSTNDSTNEIDASLERLVTNLIA